MAVTLQRFTGFEHGVVNSFAGTTGLFASTSAGVTIDTTTPASGLRSCRLQGTAATISARIDVAATSRKSLATHVKTGAGGSSGRSLLYFVAASNNDLRIVWLNGQFSLRYWNGTSLVTLANGADTGLADDVWRHVEMLWDASANPHIFKWFVEGVEQPTPTSQAFVATTIATAHLGDPFAAYTRDDRFDDLVIAQIDSLTDIVGEKYVRGYSPSAVGAHNIATTGVFFRDVGGTETELTNAETTSYSEIDDLPLDADANHVLVRPKYTGTPTTPPTFNSVGAKSASAGAESPASAAPVGALELLIATTIAGGTVTLTANGGSAWTAITAQDVTGGEKLYLWWRVKQSGDSAPTVTPSSDHICCTIAAYTNVARDGNPVVHLVAPGSEVTSDTSLSFVTGQTTTEAQELCVVVYTSGADSNTGQAGAPANTSLTSVTLRAEYQTNAGGGGGFAIADGVRAVAGTMGTWTDNTMVTATPKSYIALAIRALPPATKPTAAEYLEYALAASSESVAPDAVEGIVAVANSGSGTDGPIARIDEGGSSSIIYSGNITSATPIYRRAIFTTKPSGGVWTDAAFDSTRLRFGLSLVIDNEPRLHSAMLEVLFTPSAGTPINSSDTGAGADATPTLTAAITSAESGADSEASTPSAQLASADVNGVTTENATIAVPISAGDVNGATTEAATLAAAIPASDGSAGAATYGDQQYGWGTYGGTFTSVEDQTLTAQFTQSDTGVAAEEAVIGIVASDTGTATETATVSVPISASDTNGATTEGASVTTGEAKSGSDSNGTTTETATIAFAVSTSDVNGTTTEAASLTAAIPGSDAGTGTDVGVVGLFVNASETGTGADAATLKAVYSNADTSTGSETGTPTAAIPTADANGVTTESTALTIGVAETGTAAEGASLVARYTVTDVNLSFVDVGGTGAPVVSTDSGVSTQAATLVAQIPSSQTATGVDSATVKAVYSDTDSGTGTDQHTLVARYTVTETSIVVDSGVAGAQQAISVSDTFSAIEVATKQELVTVGALARGRVVVVYTVNGQVKVNLGKSRITVNHVTGRVERIR
jgi:hypothetical protein